VNEARILLGQPTTVHPRRHAHKKRCGDDGPVMIPLMAGLTPDDFSDVTLCDERIEDIDFDGRWAPWSG